MQNKSKKRNTGITLIALIITIIILITLAGVSINMLVGENGLITMAQRAKNETEQAQREEEQALAGIFGKNYVDYNGQLSIKEGKLTNQYEENVVLRGMSAGNGKGIESLTEKYYNKESLSVIKSWGANVLRIPVDTDAYYQGYASNPDIINRVSEIADICIELDMYAIIDWHVLYEGNPNTYAEQAKEFFSQIATKYKDVPNILYEICNEPNGDDVTWEVIKNYANEIIPVIRNIDSDSIVIVGTPSWSHNVDEVVGSELEHSNIMYTSHMYASTLNSDRMNRLKTAVENNIPVIVTEFGTAVTGWGTQDGLLLENSNIIANYMEENNISWCNWSMTDHYEGLALVKYNQWDNSLNDNILSESGKYIKQLLQNAQIQNNPVMMEYEENYAFWNEEYRNNVTSIIIENEIDNDKINNAVEHWDVSFANNNSVIAYIENDSENAGKYILHITGEGGVYCAPNSRNLFSDFISLKNVDFNNLDTTNVNDMGFMFSGDVELESIDLKNFKTNNVTYMERIFYNCANLKTLDFSSFDFTKVVRFYEAFGKCTNLESIKFPTQKSDMISVLGLFSHCENLKEIDLSSFNTERVTAMNGMFSYCYNIEGINFGDTFSTENVTSMREMFYQCNSLKKLDLSKFNTSKVTDMYYMFGGCYSLQTLDLKNFNTENVENMSRMFHNCNSLTTLNVSSFNTSKVTNMAYMFQVCRQLTQLDLSNFDTSNVTDMTFMLSNLNNVQKINLSNANFDSVKSYDNMLTYTNSWKNAIIIVKDENAKSFIQSRLDEVGNTAEIQISNGQQE